jgi:hypothetical protein
VLAAVGSLGALVEAASLIFLVTFAVVNVVAAVELDGRRWAALLGAGGATGAAAVLIVQLGTETPLHLAGIVGVVVAIVVARRLAGSNGRA